VLTERFDDAADAQHVSIQVAAPVIGTIYEYAGAFQYEIRQGEHMGEGSTR
jgi:RPA family protein